VIINYWILPIALVLLWLPRQWLRFGTRYIPGAQSRRPDRHANARNPGDVSLRLRQEMAKPRNWIDLVRATVGSLVIGYSALQAAPEAHPDVHTQIFMVKCIIFVVAVLIQMVRFEGRLTLAPPIFFVFGLSFGLIGWMAACFAIVAICVFNLVLPGPASFLFVFSGLQAVFGVMFARSSFRETMLAAGLSFFPVVFSLMTKRRLMQLSKKSKSTVRVKT